MSKRVLTSVLLASLCLAAVPALGAPLQKSEISPGANWMLHADLDAFRSSTLGKLLLTELKAQGVDAKLQEFATIFSFNPLTDIRGVTLYGKGKDRNNAVGIIDGQFDADKLLAIVRMNPQYEEVPYQGVTLHRWLNEDKKGGTAGELMYGYINKGHEVVISTGLDALKQEVDILKGSGAGASAGLASQIPQANNGTFLQIAATGIGEMVGENPQAAILKQANSLSLAAGEAGEKAFVGLQLQAQSPEVAENILKMAQGVVAMAQLAVQEQPKLSELAKSVNVVREDKTVQARFEAPSQSIFAFLKEQWAKKQQQQTPQTQTK
jgi:hypothetical protein